jgi:hypothetical protein
MFDIHKDYEKTLSHHGMFTNMKIESKADEVLGEVYTRVVGLYEERLTYIHACGMDIAALLACWIEECGKTDEYRNADFVAACESTLAFLERDYICRKLYFDTEIYALLEGCDEQSAEMVRGDLEHLWPWTKADFIMRLTSLVADYDRVELAHQAFVREVSGAHIAPCPLAVSPGPHQMSPGLWEGDNADCV